MKKRLDRQSFLGPRSDDVLADTTIAIIGLGGGGSHIAQQAAHVGIGKYILIDPDTIDETNLNRLIGGMAQDVSDEDSKVDKVDIAERLIRGILPNAQIIKKKAEWQTVSECLKVSDVIVGGLDSVRGKSELEAFARRFLIPYIDMGMDVHKIDNANFLISGQVILSSPHRPCLRCFGLVTDEGLAKEAQRYGAAGGRPQVVWPNGALASAAMGLLMQLVTPWHNQTADSAYLEYDGNLNTMKVSERFRALQGRPCPHYRDDEVGDITFDIRHKFPDAIPDADAQSNVLTKNARWWRKFFW